jgi:predicted TIM-barrel fold metal-dependent hydrolase
MGRRSDLRDDAAFADLADLLALARHPNVAVKVSAVPRFSSHAYPYRNLHPYVRRIYDAFGPRRMLWGTDLSRLRSSYRQAVTMFTEEMPFFSAADLEWIMGRSAYAWLDWPFAIPAT